MTMSRACLDASCPCARAAAAYSSAKRSRSSGSSSGHDVGGREVDAEPDGPRAHLGLVAEHREVDDRRAQQRAGGLQDAVVVALGQHDVLALRTAPARAARTRTSAASRPSTRATPSSVEQRVGVDVLLEQRERRVDLALRRRR